MVQAFHANIIYPNKQEQVCLVICFKCLYKVFAFNQSKFVLKTEECNWKQSILAGEVFLIYSQNRLLPICITQLVD